MDSAKPMSDDAVRAKTGRAWDEWFRELDEIKAPDLGHKETAKRLESDYGVDSWWAQGITIRYEQERGIREPGQRSDGLFAVTAQKTIRATSDQAFRTWADADQMSRWFGTNTQQEFVVGGRFRNDDGDSGEYKKIVPGKLIRFTWENKSHQPGSVVTVEFAPKGEDAVTLTITHEKLHSRKEADDLRTGWKWALDCLKSYLETGVRISYDDWEKAQKPRTA